jgi:hypothetical protein
MFKGVDSEEELQSKLHDVRREVKVTRNFVVDDLEHSCAELPSSGCMYLDDKCACLLSKQKGIFPSLYDIGYEGSSRITFLGKFVSNIHKSSTFSITYDHRTLKTRLPVRSALFKQRTGGLVVRWVTTSEYPLLYVFAFFCHSIWVRMVRRKSFNGQFESLLSSVILLNFDRAGCQAMDVFIIPSRKDVELW